ncbi:hypothetical protein ACFFLM_07975 [Deinococcus oregonensis]|uniref:Uncharacterized protein n=1 Tax=Deinococcus oregonensis TaxID=1805970 RepID=A0ABV6AWM2_9DEIO
MGTPAYFIYTYQGKDFTTYSRYRGMNVPAHLIDGPESAFWIMCYIAEYGLKSGKAFRKNTDPLPYEPYGIDPHDDNPYGREYNEAYAYYGGFIVNFDLKVILLGCDFMMTRQKLDADHPLDQFLSYPKHRNALSKVIEEFWVGWRVFWVKEEEFVQYAMAEIEFDQINTAADALPQRSYWRDESLHIPQEQIEQFYREEFNLLRGTESIDQEPFVIDSLHQEIFEDYVAQVAQKLMS